jgi:stearoyl-CoA desaturase (delta-9 desaturase)
MNMKFLESYYSNAVIDWLAHGTLSLSWWQVVIYTLVTTHVTIAAVTIFLHRSQTHRALELSAIPSHFFRFWLWLGTGMVTKEWVAIHRKHHAKCEGVEDPHSPQVKGLDAVVWRTAELYRSEAKNGHTISRFGHGTPDDWLERNLYSRFSWQGVALMLIINVTLFGVLGLTVWAVQMAWIPITAGSIINGVGHFWGYRNFEPADASRNIVPWGILIGGEELHNNHHTYPTSAKLSVKAYEFDLGWVYIRWLQKMGWAKVKKLPPKVRFDSSRSLTDGDTLEALIAHRYEIMARYAREIRKAVREELVALKTINADTTVLTSARRWLHRDDERVPETVRAHLIEARRAHPALDKFVTMRTELRHMWLSTSESSEQLAARMAAWCQRAEASGIAGLRDFASRLRQVCP